MRQRVFDLRCIAGVIFTGIRGPFALEDRCLDGRMAVAVDSEMRESF